MDTEHYNRLVQTLRRLRHDASNPLTAALGGVQLLLTDPAVTDPEVRQQLREVERELRRLSEVLAELRELQRLEAPTRGEGVGGA